MNDYKNWFANLVLEKELKGTYETAIRSGDEASFFVKLVKMYTTSVARRATELLANDPEWAWDFTSYFVDTMLSRTKADHGIEALTIRIGAAYIEGMVEEKLHEYGVSKDELTMEGENSRSLCILIRETLYADVVPFMNHVYDNISIVAEKDNWEKSNNSKLYKEWLRHIPISFPFEISAGFYSDTLSGLPLESFASPTVCVVPRSLSMSIVEQNVPGGSPYGPMTGSFFSNVLSDYLTELEGVSENEFTKIMQTSACTLTMPVVYNNGRTPIATVAGLNSYEGELKLIKKYNIDDSTTLKFVNGAPSKKVLSHHQAKGQYRHGVMGLTMEDAMGQVVLTAAGPFYLGQIITDLQSKGVSKKAISKGILDISTYTNDVNGFITTEQLILGIRLFHMRYAHHTAIHELLFSNSRKKTLCVSVDPETQFETVTTLPTGEEWDRTKILILEAGEEVVRTKKEIVQKDREESRKHAKLSRDMRRKARQCRRDGTFYVRGTIPVIVVRPSGREYFAKAQKTDNWVIVDTRYYGYAAILVAWNLFNSQRIIHIPAEDSIHVFKITHHRRGQIDLQRILNGDVEAVVAERLLRKKAKSTVKATMSEVATKGVFPLRPSIVKPLVFKSEPITESEMTHEEEPLPKGILDHGLSWLKSLFT